MKTILTFLSLFLISLVSFAQQNGSISGDVNARDGSPAAYVAVGVKGHKAGTLTNEKGAFRINKLEPGTYTLVVSAVNLTPEEKQVVIKPGENTVVNFTLNINTSQLQEVVINGRQNKVKVDNPSPSLRLQEPLLEAPQNIQVVTSQSLAEQQVISMSDGVIRNVSGAIRQEHWADLYANITMRGSQIQAFRNGFNVVNSYWGPLTEDASFVDHIEFVKGPAGFMLANGDPSGLYNVVTKKPTGQEKGEFTLTGGSYGLYRATLDLDGKLSKDGKLLYRLNLAGQNKGSFRANEYNDRYSIAPVISYQVDDQTKLTVEYTLQHAKMSDVGSYYVFGTGGYATLPANFTMSPPGLAPTVINDHSLFVNLQHQLNSHWKLTAQAAYFNYGQQGSDMWPSAVNPDGTILRAISIWDAKSTMALGQAFLNGDVTTGQVHHRILGGIDIGNKKYDADWSQGHELDTAGALFNTKLPVYGPPVNGYPVWDRSQNIEARSALGGGHIEQQYTGIYVQDELGFLNNKVRLTLAGRYTYVQQSEWGGSPYNAKRVTPRIGVSVSVDDQTSVYGLRDEAFIPQSGRVAVGTVKPITGNNTEFGIKRDWMDGRWNTTLSVYRIIKNNELTADPNASPNSGLSVILGQKRSQGIEFDLRGEIVNGLNLTANYAYTDSKVTKVTSGVPDINVGDVVPGFAKHVVNTWLSYRLQQGPLKGVGANAGFTAYLKRATDTWSDTDVRLPNYFKVDAGLFWEGSKMRIAANCFNVLNKYLYSGSYYSYLNAFYWQAEAPRNYRLSIAYKW